MSKAQNHLGPERVILAPELIARAVRQWPLLRPLLPVGAGYRSHQKGPIDSQPDSNHTVFAYCLKGGGWCDTPGKLQRVQAGDLMVMFGSSIFFILKTTELRHTERFWSSNFLEEGTYAFTGGMSTAGSLTTWFRDQFAQAELEQERANFLAMLTHDIKNPLGVILGCTEILMEEARAMRLDCRRFSPLIPDIVKDHRLPRARERLLLDALEDSLFVFGRELLVVLAKELFARRRGGSARGRSSRGSAGAEHLQEDAAATLLAHGSPPSSVVGARARAS